MTAIIQDAWWCAVETTLLAVIALAATAGSVRRSPAAAARVAAAAAATIFAASIAAFAPLPQWSFPETENAKRAPVSREGTAAHAPVANSAPAEDGGGVPTISLSTLARQWNRAAGAVQTLAEKPAANDWAAAALAATVIGSGLGFAGLLRSWRHVQRLRRESRSLSDARAHCIAESVANALAAAGARVGLFQLRESPAVASPTVLGGAPTVVVLPVGWAAWSDAELQAALAHEMAHVARSDFRTRLLAGAVQALHWYHPLVRWLCARHTLAQEAAADRLAATAAGGTRAYLHSLSQLAVWLDRQTGLRAEPVVAPRLSSNLIRRMTMLKSMEGRRGGEVRRRGGWLAAAMIVACGIGTTALGGGAEKQGATSAPGPLPPRKGAGDKLFQREPFDFGLIGDNPLGAYVIRVAEIMAQPQLRTFVESETLPQMEIAEMWEREFGADVPCPALDLSAIDWIAGIGQFKVTAYPPLESEPEMTHQVMLGSPETIVRFNQPVDWRAWFRTHFPNVQEKQHGDAAYLELPPLPAFGPQSLCVAAVDERTIVLMLNDRVEQALAPRPRPTEGRVAEQWRRLEGGLMTFVVTDAEVKTDPELPTDPLRKLATELAGDCRGLGYAFDLDPSTGQLAMRCELVTTNAQQAAELQGALSTMLAIWKTAVLVPAAGEPTPSERFGEELRATAQVARWQTGDGQAGVLLEAQAALPQAAEVHAPTKSAAVLGQPQVSQY